MLERETESNAFHVRMSSVRPNPSIPDSVEHRLNIDALPVRLYIDQDAYNTLNDFFKYKSKPDSGETVPDSSFFRKIFFIFFTWC
jgi:hypothetical protein